MGGSTTTLFKPTKNDVMIGHEFLTDQHSLKKGDNACSLVGIIPRLVFDLLIAKGSLKNHYLGRATPLPLFYRHRLSLLFIRARVAD